MSYSCTISFKELPANEVYSFLTKIKSLCISKIDEIAGDNYLWSPINKRSTKELYQQVNKIEDIDFIWTDFYTDIKDWANNSIFKYRYFYLSDYNLLGVYSIPNCLHCLFDNTCYFQNSCDQDYEFDEWKGISIFEKIADKYKNMDTDIIIHKYATKYDYDTDDINNNSFSDEKLNYIRKSCCYDEIWSIVENTLWDDDSIVYFSIFGPYDIQHLQKFAISIKKYCVKWWEEIYSDN